MPSQQELIEQRARLLERTVAEMDAQFKKYEQLIHSFLLSSLYADGTFSMNNSETFYLAVIQKYLKELEGHLVEISEDSIEEAFILGLLITKAEAGQAITESEARQSVKASPELAAVKLSTSNAISHAVKNASSRLPQLLTSNNSPEDFSRTLKESGFIGIVDAAGRAWKPEVYAKMLLRTQLLEADVTVKRTEAAKIGLDLAYIPDKHVSNPCNLWENTVISLNGKDTRFPTYDQAKATGEIFHPNCQHGHLILITSWATVPPSVVSKTEAKYGTRLDLSEEL